SAAPGRRRASPTAGPTGTRSPGTSRTTTWWSATPRPAADGAAGAFRSSSPPRRLVVEVGVRADPGVHGDRGRHRGVDRPRRAELRDREGAVAGRTRSLGEPGSLLAEKETDAARHLPR